METTQASIGLFTLIKPQLKAGIFAISRAGNTYVGKSDHGIEFEGTEVRRILLALTGLRTCEEIAAELECDLATITDLVSELEAIHFLDTQKTPIALSNRHSSRSSQVFTDENLDATYQQIKSKIRPELALTTWNSQVSDGGVGLVSARQAQTINIYGSTRVAMMLYEILLSSGLSQTSLIIPDEHRAIADTDTCVGFLHSYDVGGSLQNRICEVRPDLSLFPLNPSSDNKSKAIAICVGPPQPELLQEWMSECIPHIFIEDPECASITIGPFVIPGVTPCWRCTVLTQDDEHLAWTEVQWQRRITPPAETPVSVSYYIAGLIALEILRFIDTGQSDFLGSTLRIDYRKAIDTARRTFSPHPACGCHW